MSILARYLTTQIREDLKDKMVFVGGPRQVGKTTLAKSLLTDRHGYMNWDVAKDRERILKREFHPTSLWVFDEIHKYHSWRNYLKGVYDSLERSNHQQILVTGSARLDYYRYSGDSLQGRYHYLRMHPLSLPELKSNNNKGLMDLLNFGGFPEPYFASSVTKTRRWSLEYRTRLIREDLVQLEKVHDLGNLELLFIRLPDLVGSPLSINSLREDLQLSYKTVSLWLQILERLYSIFRISPFGAPKIKAIKKAQKHYQFDWTLVNEMPERFENLVASALLKWVHFRQDAYAENTELCYFRDIEGREVDFVITNGKKPNMLIECKWDDAPTSSALRYLKSRFPACEAWQISAVGKKDFVDDLGIRVAPAVNLLRHLI